MAVSSVKDATARRRRRRQLRFQRQTAELPATPRARSRARSRACFFAIFQSVSSMYFSTSLIPSSLCTRFRSPCAISSASSPLLCIVWFIAAHSASKSLSPGFSLTSTPACVASSSRRRSSACEKKLSCSSVSGTISAAPDAAIHFKLVLQVRPGK